MLAGEGHRLARYAVVADTEACWDRGNTLP